MKNCAASRTLSLIFIFVGFILISLGVFWLFNGIGDDDSGLVLYGSLSLLFGFVIAGIANFF
jgi:uncharacterized membrane protein|tara:strand:+ start:247 stop:432 length:186 start_codon:yes stop_codon:yes gene_type:complete